MSKDTDFEMWGFSSCPFCQRLKDYLADLGIPFYVVNEEDGQKRLELYRFWTQTNTAPGQAPATSMPQLFVHGLRLGGHDEVKALPREWLLDLLRGTVRMAA